MANKGRNTNGWDVLLASVDKGQLPVLIIGLIFLILTIKLPADKASEIIEKGISALEHYHILGWILTMLSVFGWIYTSKRQRKVHSEEMNRVTYEKSKMQQGKFANPLSSTKPKINKPK